MCSSQELEEVWAGFIKEGWRDVLGKSCIVGATIYVCQTACGIMTVTINLCDGDFGAWWH